MKRVIILLSVIFLGMQIGLLSSTHARTWYVKVDGSGDAPTIQAGVDSSAAGDTVLVGPGSYYIVDCISLKPGIIILSEEGPNMTIIEPIEPWNVICVFAMTGNTEIIGFWLKQSQYADIILRYNGKIEHNIIEGGYYGIEAFDGSGEIRNNLIFGSNQGIYLDYASNFVINNNIILSGLNAIDCSGLMAFCNDMPSEPWFCFGGEPNFDLDPQFCGVESSGNYYLQGDSPCAPGNHPDEYDCGLIGPLPVGCGTVATEQKTWGEIKAIYKE